MARINTVSLHRKEYVPSTGLTCNSHRINTCWWLGDVPERQTSAQCKEVLFKTAAQTLVLSKGRCLMEAVKPKLGMTCWRCCRENSSL